MTYLQFHLVFLLPPLLLLIYAEQNAFKTREGRRALSAVGIIAVIALLYTTPWDNFLVWKGVWSYGPDAVLATLGFVPIEEYLFFLLQPLLTGLWFMYIVSQQKPARSTSTSSSPRWVGGLLGLAGTGAGLWLVQTEPGLYLGLILVWACPVTAAQWGYAGHWFWQMRREFLLSAAIPTIYLWIADRMALTLGIWSIADRYSTGIHLIGLPLEEAVFFLLTNLLVVQGLIMLLHESTFP